MATPAILKEIIQRMESGEKSLHTKTIEPYKVVRIKGLPTLLADLVAHDIKRKKFEVVRRRNNILILRRPT